MSQAPSAMPPSTQVDANSPRSQQQQSQRTAKVTPKGGLLLDQGRSGDTQKGLRNWEFMNHDMFLPPRIQSKAALTRVSMEQFHTAEKKTILSEAELLGTVSGGTIKGSDMKATIDS